MNFKKVSIDKDTLIKDAVQIIDEGGVQIALIVDSQKKLIGTVTDGDVRRGIVSGVDLSEAVEKIMNPDPVFVNQSNAKSEAKKLMKKRRISQIPVVNEGGKVVDLIIASEVKNKKRDNWVVIMAGGLGQRLGDLTKDTPKPLLKVGSKPILENILNNFIDYGFQKFYFTVNYKYEKIMDYFGDGSRWGVEINYIKEDKRLGTAGSLSLLPEKPSKPIVVMNGDLLTKVNFGKLLQFHEKRKIAATICVREYDFQVPYGVIQTDGVNFKSIEEKPVQRFFVNAGVYSLSPEAIAKVPEDTYYDMTSLFEQLKEEGETSMVFPIHEYWLDIGQVQDYQRANLEFQEGV